MKFHYGAVPDDVDFQPEQEGWYAIRELSPIALQVAAIPVAILITAIVGWLLILCFPHELTPSYITYDPITETESLNIIPPLLTIVAIIILLIPIHELIHALSNPDFGFSDQTIIGLWPLKGVAYAAYQGEMPRNRFLLVLVAPFIALSLIPIIVLAFSRNFPLISSDLRIAIALFSLFAGVSASGDFVGLFLLISQVPNSAIVRNKGWETYWKPIK